MAGKKNTGMVLRIGNVPIAMVWHTMSACAVDLRHGKIFREQCLTRENLLPGFARAHLPVSRARTVLPGGYLFMCASDPMESGMWVGSWGRIGRRMTPDSCFPDTAGVW